MNRYLKSAIAGTVATVPMTLVMLALHRRLPKHQRYPLPPREITEQLVARTHTQKFLADKLTGTTLTAHFAYGAAVGALYASAQRRLNVRTAFAGPAYGVAVWVVSYLSWIPALGILRPATQHPPRRNALMLFAHIVWGAALAGATLFIDRATNRR